MKRKNSISLPMSVNDMMLFSFADPPQPTPVRAKEALMDNAWKPRSFPYVQNFRPMPSRRYCSSSSVCSQIIMCKFDPTSLTWVCVSHISNIFLNTDEDPLQCQQQEIS